MAVCSCVIWPFVLYDIRYTVYLSTNVRVVWIPGIILIRVYKRLLLFETECYSAMLRACLTSCIIPQCQYLVVRKAY